MDDISPAAFTYTINDTNQDANALPTATPVSGDTISDFCTITHVFTTDDPAVNACLDFSTAPTAFLFDIGCDQTAIAGVLGTNVSDDFVVTWTSTISSPYSDSISTVAKTATLTVKNPCADSDFVTITGSDVTAQTYIIT